MITLALKLNEQDRGKGFWKLNTSLLFDEAKKNIIRVLIKEEIEKYNMNTPNECDCITYRLFLDTLKMAIRGRTIAYSARKKKINTEREKHLTEQIDHLEEKIGSGNITYDLEKLEECKLEIKTLREKKIKGIMIRTKAQYYEPGEKPTKYFLSLEKRNYVSKLIKKLEVENKDITNPDSIPKLQKQFYENLCKSNRNEISNQLKSMFLSNNELRNLDDPSKDSCEGPITDTEAISALKNMKNDKTPGNDGLPAEFYKIFWKDIGPILLKCYDEIYAAGELSLTQKQGVISCLPKGDKPRMFLKNWRPISLLNTDCKILTGVLASRMKNVLPSIMSIIGSQQKGFVLYLFFKNRYIGENTRLVYDLISHLNDTKQYGMLLLIDFEKAFDTIEWNYIKLVLKAYNFGESFIKWFSILYNGASSCVINNGYFSNMFRLERGCRQGDPLSPYLLILAVKPLSNAIKCDVSISGIKIRNRECKIGQYADDTFLLLNGSKDSIRNAFSILNTFGDMSGLKVNMDKTQAVWLGNRAGKNIKICI